MVIYDADCGFCRRSVALLRLLDPGGELRYEPSTNRALLERLGITPAEANQELKVVGGERVSGGYDAIVAALAVLPRTRWLAPLMRFAPIRFLGRRAYGQVAARRHCLYPRGPR